LWYNHAVSRENAGVFTIAKRGPHIGLNAQLLSLKPNYRSAGINRYIYNILLGLSRCADSEHFTVFLSERDFPAVERFNNRLSRLPTDRPLIRILWEQLVQPWLLARSNIDLLHSMAFVMPLWSPCPSVATIYDLSFLRYPHNFRAWNRLYLSTFTRLSARKAGHLIAISKSTARDVEHFFGISPERVSVIYCGVEAEFHPLPVAEVERFRRERGLPDRMILYVGTIEPRKNLGRLLEAYRHLLRGTRGENYRNASQDTPRLVIAGAKGWLYENILARVEELGLSGDVMLPGYVPGSELPLWYNAAECFVYPSTYEGFGLPVLEAMACGTPVVTSNSSSLPEVVGQAGYTVSPDNVEELAETLIQVLGDGELRARLRQQGLARAALFSWDKAARETIAVYNRVLNHGG
jgi:glycosyltransferase involved in cell wall biosynthesis